MTETLDGPLPQSARLSVASLALAIVGLAVFCSAYVAAGFQVGAVDNVDLIAAALAGGLLGSGAVAIGVIARRRAKRGHGARPGVALAGIMVGLLATLLPALILAALAFTMYSSYEDFNSCVKGSGHPTYLCLKECPVFLDSWCRSRIGW
ncbi:hypothetical protein [Mycobacterium palustre]|uniref:DUF4190 domain-containing protein n=1 Tax=Mycobacterium palustre TaxID=153971 RepID=A0A1X1ZWP4_9MYCO|nr:hypothetical protein [Mycobacterium palustre]MCV7100542.1 hypothetical protein [Mycobacterium palustre]ORW28593.1 hypothetical protein AWC19_27005 [Mycobacterium palustre]